MSVWNKVRNYGEYTQKNLDQADKRGGVWRSLNYHVYTPRKEIMNDQGLWHSIRNGKSFKELYDTSSQSPNQLPYSSNGTINYTDANPILEKMLKDKEQTLNINPEYKNKPKRGVLDRISDSVNVGQYAVMGALYNATDKDPRTKWYQGALEGLKSANPIGEDYKEYEKSFGDVLDNLGWKKEKNPDGKWYKPWTWNPKNTARNITSLAGDMYFDPLNLLSLGTAELVGGTGKKIGKEVVEETSEQTAKQILKEVGDKATTENVDEIIRQLDKLKGIKKGGRGVSFGLQNVPFLNKIGGGKYNKSIVDADTIREISDKVGIGGTTNKLFRGLKESKIGKLFNNVDLQKLARLDDVEAGKVLKFVEKGYGNNIDLIRSNIDTIEWVDNNLANFPKEKQELITDLLENPIKWRKRKYQIDFGDTELGNEFKEKINKFLENVTEDDLFPDEEVAKKIYTEKEIMDYINEYMRSKKNQEIREFYKNLPEDAPKSIDEFYDYLRNNAPPQQRSALTRSLEKLKHPIKEDKVKNIVDVLDGKKTIENITNIDAIPDKTTYEDVIDLLDESNITWKNYRKFYNESNYDNIVQLAMDNKFTSKDEKVRMLNDAIFSGKEVISPISNQYRINELYDMLTDDVPFEKIANEIDKSYKSSLNTRGVEVHEFLRNKFNYSNYGEEVLGKIDKYENKIKKSVSEQLEREFGYSQIPQRVKSEYNELLKQMKIANSNNKEHLIKKEHMDKLNSLWEQIDTFNKRYKELYNTHPEYKNLDKYLGIQRDREYLSKELFRMPSGEFKKYITEEANKDISNIIEGTYKTNRNQFVQQQETEFAKLASNSPNLTQKDMANDLTLKYFGVHYDSLKVNTPTGKIRKGFIDNIVSKANRGSHFEPTEEMIEDYLLKKYTPTTGSINKPIKESIQKLKFPNYEKGNDVSHEVFGRGKIASREGNKLDILFNNEKNISFNLEDFNSKNIPLELESINVKPNTIEKIGEVVIGDAGEYVKKLPKQTKEQLSADISNNIVKSGKEFVDIETCEVLDNAKDIDTNLVRVIEFKNNQKKITKIIDKDFNEIIPNSRDEINKTIEKVMNGKNSPKDVYEKVKLYQEALTDKEVFDNLARFEYGDDVVDKATTGVRDVIVNGKTIDEQVLKITEKLAGLFDDMAVKEMDAGILGDDKFVYNYVYHMLTPDAKKFIDKPKNKHLVTDMFGFGNKFNVHNLDRKYEGTIKEINKHMKDKYGVDKFFETEISNIYLSRAMKHNEVMYDAKFTKEMFNKFGKRITHISQLDGSDKAILSYHDLKKFTYKLDDDNKVKLFQKLGIADDVLDEYVTPLIELTPEQVKNIGNYAPGLPMHGVNDIMVDKANKLAKIQKAKDTNTLLELHDKFLHLYKMNVTAVLPGFHFRNKYSNMFQNYLDIGSEAIHPKNQMDALKILIGKEGSIKTRLGKSVSFEEVRQQMQAHGLFDSGYFTSELHQSLKSGKLPKLENYNLNPLDAEKFIPYKLGKFTGGIIENQDKIVNYVANLKIGKSFSESAEHVNKFLFDYGDLTDFEMNTMKRIVPFYTWIRKNTPLQFEMMLKKPEIYRNLFKTLNTVESNTPKGMEIDREYLNDFAQDWVQLPGKVKNPEGREEPLLWNPNLPYDDVDRFFNPLTPVESTKKLITQTNPLIKMPIELGLNKNIFFDSPIERYPGHKVNMPGYLDPIGNIKGNPKQMSPKVRYVLDQIASLQSLGKYVEKKGFDRTVHGINHLSGVKVMSYDYEKYKYYMLQERLKELENLKQ